MKTTCLDGLWQEGQANQVEYRLDSVGHGANRKCASTGSTGIKKPVKGSDTAAAQVGESGAIEQDFRLLSIAGLNDRVFKLRQVGGIQRSLQHIHHDISLPDGASAKVLKDMILCRRFCHGVR